MKKLLVTFLALLFAVSVFAQEATTFPKKYVHISAAFSGTNFSTDADNAKFDYDTFTAGGSLGLFFGIRLTGQDVTRSAAYVEFGPEFTYGVGSNSDSDSKLSLATLALPTNIVFKVPLNNTGDRLILLCGVNPKLNLKASLEYKTSHKEVTGVIIQNGHNVGTSTTTVSKTNTLDLLNKDMMGKDFVANSFQLGVNVGVGLELGRTLISYRFTPDMMPFQSYSNSKTNISTRTMSHIFSLSYIL